MPAALYIIASFRILGPNFVPTPVLGSLEGQAVLPSSKNQQTGIWSLSLESLSSEDINDHLNPLILMLEPEIANIHRLTKAPGLEAQFFVSITATFGKDAFMSGRIDLHVETLLRMASLGAKLVIDFYADDAD